MSLAANLEVRSEAKRAKLLQYAERVWQIRQDDEDQLATHRLTALGEHSDVSLDVSRRVLEASL